ncbi:MAG: ABC-F family ATP-binding cassette domain-containing protein [Anaerolineae bacterium]|nr:ABC-F family ATP-binding cassette domain-containing protein [Anaerolineae bacterium]
MSIIVGTNVSKSFGAFDLFTDLNFSVARGDKIALVGANGCGKTTLLTIVAGTQEPNIGGGVSMARGTSRGYLSQTAEESNENTVWQEMQTAFVAINELAQKLAQLEHEMADPAKAEKALARYGELQHEYELKGGYEIDAKIKRVLSGLGFKQGEEYKSLAQLSGGQRVRAALARLLLQSPDVLLLDEPTNHLDAQGIEWLESYLQEWEGTLLVVSHDRYFLDEACDHVWELGRRSDGAGGTRSYLEFYRGGYTDYVAQRTERREWALKQFEAQQEVIAKEQEYIRRNMAGQNTNIAKGKLKRLNRMERLEKPLETRAMHLRLNSGPRSGNIVLETDSVVIGYKSLRQGDKETTRQGEEESALSPPLLASLSPLPLFKAPNLQLLRTERAALIGPNGTGKTTFLKTVLGDLEPLSGEVRLGASLRLGYFAQAHEGLNLDNTILEELMSAHDEMKMSEARNILGRFLFSGDDAFKKVGMLSGGERGRVALAKLTLQGANFLLLDEPTNHLDIPSQEILTEALNNFDGTLLMVSHDRYLVAALATQIWSLERDADANADGKTQLKIFRGTYDAWIESKLIPLEEIAKRQEPRAKSQEQKVVAVQSKTQPNQPTTKLTKNQEQQRLKKLEQTEQRIAHLERRLTELSWEMEVAANDYAKMKALGEEYTRVEGELAEAWQALEAIA